MRSQRAETVYEKSLLDDVELPVERIVYTQQDFVDPVMFISEASERRERLKNNKQSEQGEGTGKGSEAKGEGTGKESGAKIEKEKETGKEKGRKSSSLIEREKEKGKEQEEEKMMMEFKAGGNRDQRKSLRKSASLRGVTSIIGLKNSLSHEEKQKIIQDLQKEGGN